MFENLDKASRRRLLSFWRSDTVCLFGNRNFNISTPPSTLSSLPLKARHWEDMDPKAHGSSHFCKAAVRPCRATPSLRLS